MRIIASYLCFELLLTIVFYGPHKRLSNFEIDLNFPKLDPVSSFVESTNSSMGQSFAHSSNSFLGIITLCLQKDAQNMKEEQLTICVVNLNSTGLPTDITLVKACRSVFSDLISSARDGYFSWLWCLQIKEVSPIPNKFQIIKSAL